MSVLRASVLTVSLIVLGIAIGMLFVKPAMAVPEAWYLYYWDWDVDAWQEYCCGIGNVYGCPVPPPPHQVCLPEYESGCSLISACK